MRDITAWLEELGRGKYSDVFAANAIDLDIVTELGELDLKELGVPLGDATGTVVIMVADQTL